MVFYGLTSTFISYHSPKGNLFIFGSMLQFITDYLHHRFTSKTRHGIHSPFVYRLVDEVIYDFHAKPDYQQIEKLRRQLLSDNRYIILTDLGAGSRVNNNKRKQVKQIARYALKPPRVAQLIYRLARHVSPLTLIELGTCLGTTTAYLAKAAPEAKIYSVEGCPQTAAIAAENLAKLGIDRVQLITGDFGLVLPQIISAENRVDFIFIDGNHRKVATLDYFYQCLPNTSENTLMIFDDIYWSGGMKEAWNEIKLHPHVSVTIDLFWIGLVFFRKSQAKEDFKVRF